MGIKNNKLNPGRRKNRVIHDASNFAVVEGYKTIRTNLNFAVNKIGCKKVIVTSSVPEEGKSLSCSNLAVTMAQTKSKVLIIDCDMRKPTIHKLFKIKGIPGLSELLVGMNGLAECIQPTTYENLDVICGGTIPPNPAELLGSTAMDQVLEFLTSRYDYILLDTPPVNVVADAMVLSSKVDGVLMVVRQNVTTHPDLRHALASLEFAKAKVLGSLLNGVESSSKSGYYKYGYGHRRIYEEYK